MPIWVDPVTRQRVLHQADCSDLQYDLDPLADPAIRDESLPLIGPWEDFTGSGGVQSRAQQMFASSENQLFGTEPGILGDKLPELNVVGQNLHTHRRRRIKRHINLKTKRIA